MILYNALSNYHILTCILHKLKYHQNDKSILGLPNYHKNLNLIKKNLEKSNLFDEVIVIEEFNWQQLKNHTSLTIKQDIELICQFFSENNKLDFHKFSEINICGDHNSIGVYLCKNSIKYNFFEDGCGILSDEDKLIDQFKRTNYYRYEILKELNIPGKNSCVISRFGDLKCQLKNYYNEKDIHFSVREELEKLNQDSIKKIINVFDCEFKFNIKNNSDLLLTWHYISAGMMSALEQELYYCTIVDYFSKSQHLIVKQHPADDELDYHKIFPNANIISRLLPSELLPYCNKSKFNSLITGYSTSINGLLKYTNKVIDFNPTYDYSYKKMNKYFTIAKILGQILKKFKSINIYGIGVNLKQLYNIFDNLDLNISIKDLNFLDISNLDNNQNIIIVDDIEFQNLKNINLLTRNNNIIVFINDVLVYNNNLNSNQYFPVVIKKKYLNNKFKKLIPEEELIWIYNFQSIYSTLKEINFLKRLKYTKIILEVDIDNQFLNSYIIKYHQQNLKLKEIENENNKLINELNIIKNSKAYNILIKYWSLINKIKNKR